MREFFKIISPDNESVEFYYNGTKTFETTEETEKGEEMAPEKFDDIWDTESDPARVWGTKEYFNRVDRDGWHMGRDSFADKTQRIKSKADLDLDIERIKADAEKIKLDAERMAASARKAAENVRRSTHTHTVSGSFEDQKKSYTEYLMNRSVPATKVPTTSKKKRRFKLSSTTGGLSIGGILFWSFMVYTCFFSSNDKEEKTANVTSTTDIIVEHIQTTIDNVKPEAQALINKAKGEFDKVVKEEKSPKVSDNNDPFAQNDDRYESIEDKW